MPEHSPEQKAKRFRKKSDEVEAIQWTGENQAEVVAFADLQGEIRVGESGCLYAGFEEVAQKGDYFVLDKSCGDLAVPMRPRVFEDTYEALSDIQGEVEQERDDALAGKAATIELLKEVEQELQVEREAREKLETDGMLALLEIRERLAESEAALAQERERVKDAEWVAVETLNVADWLLQPGVAADPAASQIARHKLRDLRERLATLNPSEEEIDQPDEHGVTPIDEAIVADMQRGGGCERHQWLATFVNSAIKEFEERAEGCRKLGSSPEPFIYAASFLRNGTGKKQPDPEPERPSRAKLERDIAELRRALEPFVSWAGGDPATVEANPGHPGSGQWTEYGIGRSKERVVDWFGPSDFYTALAAFQLSTQPDPEEGREPEGGPNFDACFEVHPALDRYRWRLLDSKGDPRASSEESFDTKAEAEVDIRRFCAEVVEVSVDLKRGGVWAVTPPIHYAPVVTASDSNPKGRGTDG